MKKLKQLALVTALASSLAMVGCSSSSDSNNTGTSPNNPNVAGSTGSVTVAGAAVKGVLENAKVTVYLIDNDGKREELKTALTDKDGKYTINLPNALAGSVFDVEVVASDETTMVCDAPNGCGEVAYGNKAEGISGLTLNNLVVNEGIGSISAPVTPWTTMAAVSAKSQGGDIKTNRLIALNKVRQITGVDVGNVEALAINNLDENSTASAEAKKAAIMNAVFAEMLFEGDNGFSADAFENLTASLNTLGNNDDSSKKFLKSLASKTSSVIESDKVILDKDDGLKAQLQTLAKSNLNASEKGFNFEPINVAELEKQQEIDSYKTFIADFRTWATSFNELTASLKDKESPISKTLIADEKTLKETFDQAGAVGDLITTVLDEALDTLTSDTSREKVLANIKSGENHTVNKNITISKVQNSTLADEMNIALTLKPKGTKGGLAINATGHVKPAEGDKHNFVMDFDTSLTLDQLSIAGDNAESSDIKALLASNTIALQGNIKKDGNEIKLVEFNLNLDLELTSAIKANQELGYITENQLDKAFKSLEINGELKLQDPSKAKFTGNVSAEAVRMTKLHFTKLDSNFSPGKLGMSGEFVSSKGDKFNLAASLNNRSAKTFNIVTFLEYSGRNNITVPLSIDDVFYLNIDNNEFVSFKEQYEEGKVYSYSFYAGSSNYGDYLGFNYCLDLECKDSYTDYYSEGQDVKALSSAITELLKNKIKAKYSEAGLIDKIKPLDNFYIYFSDNNSSNEIYNSHVSMDVEFKSLEDAENFVDASFTVSGELALNEMPKAKVTATLDRSSLNGATLATNVAWDDNGAKRSYDLTVSTNKLLTNSYENEEYTIVFSNLHGYKMEATLTSKMDKLSLTKGIASINGKKIGEVQLRDGKIPVIVYATDNEEEFDIESLF